MALPKLSYLDRLSPSLTVQYTEAWGVAAAATRKIFAFYRKAMERRWVDLCVRVVGVSPFVGLPSHNTRLSKENRLASS